MWWGGGLVVSHQSSLKLELFGKGFNLVAKAETKTRFEKSRWLSRLSLTFSKFPRISQYKLFYKYTFVLSSRLRVERPLMRWMLFWLPCNLPYNSQFLQVLIGVLIVRSHDLLQEELCQIVFNMAEADFPRFFSQFLPTMLMQTDNLNNNQRSSLVEHFKVWYSNESDVGECNDCMWNVSNRSDNHGYEDGSNETTTTKSSATTATKGSAKTSVATTATTTISQSKATEKKQTTEPLKKNHP